MNTIYKVISRTIELDSYNDSIDLWLFGDVHRDTSACDVDRWKYFLQKAKKTDPERTYYLGMGDYHDFASSSEEKHLKAGKIHETTMEAIEEMVLRKNRAFSIECNQMRGKLLGLIDGNHNWTFTNGKTSTDDLAERLGTECLGWLSHLTIKFVFKNMGGHAGTSVYIVPCHGKAGGKLLGTSVNQVTDLKNVLPVADIYAMGHNHDRGAWPESIIIPLTSPTTGETKLKQKRQFFCRSGSFKKAYVDGTSTYETGRLLRPADLGALRLTIAFHRDRKNGNNEIITDIEAHI